MGVAQSKEEELSQKIDELKHRLDLLSSPYEEVMAHRIFQAAQGKIRSWLGIWIAIISVLIGAAGYSGYQELVKAGSEKASNYVNQLAIPQIQQTLSTGIEQELSKLRDEAKESLSRYSLEATSSLDRELSALIEKAEARIDERLRDFAGQLSEALDKPEVAKITKESAPPVEAELVAFAYYGIYSGNDQWDERFFKRESGSPAALPQEGDTVVATANVNARAGYIEWKLASGWTNKSIVGSIKPGDRLRILEMRKIVGSFIWVKFNRIS